jgi:phosphoribosylformylglycinamidine (FGAM) synthase PurS component
MSGNSVVSNYGGRQPNNTSYIKQFSSATTGYVNWIYKTISGIKYITPSTNNDVYLPKDLTVLGSINNPSDIKIKENIYDLTNDFCNNILKIIPKKYNFINDENKKEHYGIIAQQLEEIFPKLITNTVIEDSENNINEIKAINYLELIPIIIAKMKIMQDEIDELNRRLENIRLENILLKKV